MKVYFERVLQLSRLLGIEFCCKGALKAWHSVLFFNVQRSKLCLRERDNVHNVSFCPFCGKPVTYTLGAPDGEGGTVWEAQ